MPSDDQTRAGGSEIMNRGADHIVISIDAMGGDRGPSAVVAGMARSALKNPEIHYLVCGDEKILAPMIAKWKGLSDITEIRHTAEVVAMDEKPSHAMRNGLKSSMGMAIDAVRAKEASVAVSCGNTGALMAISMIRLRKAPGVNRPAIAILWPSNNTQHYNVMLDVGADIRADADDLLKFALMGASYARNGLDIERPRVGLLNVGTEEHKGRNELHEANDLIEAAFGNHTDYEYIGFVEGGDIPSDRVDVIVTDGFTGNIALKTGEGTAKFVGEKLREAFRYSLLSRIGSTFAFTSLLRLQKRIDPRRVNGGVFLGLNGTVIKSHGSADATGVSAAIKLAFQLAKLGFSDRLAARVGAAVSESEKEQEKQTNIGE